MHFKTKKLYILPFHPVKLTSRHRYETQHKFKMKLNQIKYNQATMRSDIDSTQTKMDRLLETMLIMVQKERNDKIDTEARRIANQIDPSSLHIPRVTNPEFGFVYLEGGHIPILVPVVNTETLNHCATSA